MVVVTVFLLIWTKSNSICFKIEKKTVTTIITENRNAGYIFRKHEENFSCILIIGTKTCSKLHPSHPKADWENNSDQAYSYSWDCCLSASWGLNSVSPKNPVHHSTVILRDLKGALYWVPFQSGSHICLAKKKSADVP